MLLPRDCSYLRVVSSEEGDRMYTGHYQTGGGIIITVIALKQDLWTIDDVYSSLPCV